MKVKNILLISILLFIAYSHQIIAQETTIYTEANRTFKMAMEYWNEGNYSLAQEKFDDFLHLTPYSFLQEHENMRVQALYHHALAAKKLNNHDAEMLLVKFIDEETHTQYVPMAYYHLGDIYFGKRYYTDVIDCYSVVNPDLLTEEEYGEYYFRYAYSLFTSKKMDEAQQLFGKIVNIYNQHYFDANYYFGTIAFFKEDYATALGSFQRIEQNKKYAKAIPYYITYIYYLKGQNDNLLKYAVPKTKERGIKYMKEINHMIGQTYYKRQQFTEALPYLKYYVDKSKKVRQEDAYQLAFTQYKLGKYKQAIENFSQLTSVNDTLGQNAAYHLADCYLKANDKERARNAFDLASKMNFDPVIKEISSFNYSKLSYELNYQTIAINNFINFLNVYPTSKFNNEARNMLSSLFETSQNYNDALKVIESIPNKSQQLLQTYQRVAYYRGIEHYNDQRYDDAVRLFNLALSHPYDRNISALAHFWMSDIYYKNKMYDLALANMDAFVNTSNGKVLSDKVNPATANYTMGYSLFKQRKYKQAAAFFDAIVKQLKGKSTLLNNRSVLAHIYPDAILRSADCNFMRKNYASALKKYNQIIQYDLQGSDYAYYQKGILSGLLGNYNDKIDDLYVLLQKYPQSDYTDDALYQIALTQVALEDYQSAIETHGKILTDYNLSEYVPKSLASLGLIYYNIGKYDRALNYYTQILTKYPNNEEGQAALVGAKDVFIAKGDADGYIRFAKQFPNINIGPNAQDSIAYQIAENYYIRGECDRAIPAFGDYLNGFPKGVFQLYAHFYRGQCLYSQEKYAEAGRHYYYILEQPRNLFTDQSLDKGARVAMFIDKNYQKAFDFYEQLYQSTSRKELKLEALQGLVKTSFELRKQKALGKYSDLLLAHPNVTPDDQIDCYYYLGMVSYEERDFPTAATYFEKVAMRASNEQGAKARYLIADMQYKNGQLADAKSSASRVINETSGQEYWVVKSFILMSDIYLQQKEFFQAKATLMSILENYDKEDELRQEAQRKLDNIVAKEALESKIQARQDSIKAREQYLEMEDSQDSEPELGEDGLPKKPWLDEQPMEAVAPQDAGPSSRFDRISPKRIGTGDSDVRLEELMSTDEPIIIVPKKKKKKKRRRSRNRNRKKGTIRPSQLPSPTGN